ncbi:Serine/threonine-protein phosphatase 4 regulatory subunit 3 [Linum perenne]
MGAPEKSQPGSNSMQRVKVYRLIDGGKWDDQGTGHVTVDYLERSEELGLYVIDEDDNETLLMHRIIPDDIYRKQEDTIISWRDPEYSTELALSFQEPTGCSYIWDHICNVQRSLQFNNLNSETFHSMTSDLRELPVVELSTLPLILKTVSESGIADQMRLQELILSDPEFFRKLIDLFRICEDLENNDGLHMIFKIVRGISNSWVLLLAVLLNSPQIFEKIFGDEYIMDIIGALENDPDVPCVQRHRNFLKEHVVFKEAIPIRDPTVLSKIHQTYRVGYLKDVILARVLDEGTVANLNSIIHANNASVVSSLKDDSTFIQELFARLRSPNTSAESKKNLVYFLHEFCSLSKSLQMVQQLRLFRDLVNEGLLDVITDALQHQDKKLVLTGTDILILFLNQDPNLLRSYVVRQEGVTLLGLLVKGMITDFGPDMHCQFLEILRSLLDSYTLSGAQRDNIIEIFYEKHLGRLIDVITASCPACGTSQSGGESSSSVAEVGKQDAVKPEILSSICELLCFCVIHHPYRIKCNFLLNNVIDKVLFLTRRREKYLVVAAVRFVRTILSRHDEHLITHFVKNNLLKPIVDAFVSNGDRYNLLNSAVLELFEYIRKENLKLLVKYIVDSFWTELEKFEHLTSIQSLKVKYEQYLENSGTMNAGCVSDPRKRGDERALEKEEEDYFNEDSEEEDTASASHTTKKPQGQPSLSNGVASRSSRYLIPIPKPKPSSGGLVDYDDDEDDADYKPPPRKQPETSEDEGMMETLRLKRKLPPKEREAEVSKKPRLSKNTKARDGVFAVLCSTLSQAVLPGKKSATSGPRKAAAAAATPATTDEHKDNAEENHHGTEPHSLSKESLPGSNSSNNSAEEKEKEEEKEITVSPKSCSSDCVSSPVESKQLNGDDSPLLPPQSSPEMAVNGS